MISDGGSLMVHLFYEHCQSRSHSCQACVKVDSNNIEYLCLECSDDEPGFESMRIPTQEDEEEGPEISETECDRELKTMSKNRGNNSLRVAMPPECHQAVLTALTVH
ncbi:hypothetical protein CDAR_237341 [Caerostris darwini]|uniref:Uncharacterized protein n=1 Tax=Caerostris darwini TaxID=1538125 RepID=A0AAV4QSI3_9ARAC|nr:hypothetical protein CDAR_237341 [Caerostris darwini]